ncbi:MAG: DnaJ domain-containing protein [Candidatus Sericytochromatia bacterium]|nr:DnaJ domain-containing protein [Candidatus Sericytochromatia bacterium]
MSDRTGEPDLYELLQVHPKADAPIIKKAYYLIMQRLHPDHGGDPVKASLVNHAYEVLIDADRRTAYDQSRQDRLKARLRQVIKQVKAPATEPGCPILSDAGVIVADERNDRVLILAADGEIVWRYGGRDAAAEGRLHQPRHASFTPEGHRLIADTGASRLLEIRPDRTIHWTYDRDLLAPTFALRLATGETLVADAGHKRVIELSTEGEIAWQFSLGVAPTSAWRLPNGETLITDGRRLLRVSRAGKVLTEMPPGSWLARWKWGRRPWHGANFAIPTGPETWLVASDRIGLVDPRGQYLWEYDGLVQADIRQVYQLANGQLLVDFVHLVKRGINQEVVLLDEGRRPLWRHYYSQHRFI